MDSTAFLPSFPSDRALTADDMARIKGAEILVCRTSRPALIWQCVGSGERHRCRLNVNSIKNNLYVLAVDGIQAEIAASRSVDGTIGLYALKLLSENKSAQSAIFAAG
jgi:hypothetical protein